MHIYGAKVLKLTTGAATVAFALTACSSNPHVASLDKVSAKAKNTPAMLVQQSDAARTAGNADAAISFAELAVTADPQSFDARVALAKAYLAAGRFESASEAYGDMTAMRPDDDGARFRVALAELGKGNRRTALAALEQLGSVKGLEADVALALALAGEAERAAVMLDRLVRSGESTVRVRQNLALAQALSGEWAAAKVTASIDLAPEAVNARMTEWAALASNKDTAWRTAVVLGVSPPETDAGRPVQLAWSPPSGATQMAALDAVPAATPVAAPAFTPAAASTQTASANVAVLPAVPALRPAPVVIAKADVPAALVAGDKPITLTSISAPSPAFSARPVVAVKRNIKPKSTASGSWVVQVGAYSRAEFVPMGLKSVISKNKALADLTPTKSSIELNGTTYHRLAVGSFGSVDEAIELCRSMKSAGQKCFVRKGEGNVLSAESVKA